MISLDLVFLLVGLLIAITIHEAAHAWVANQLGDPTARLQGRISLNPLAHLDPMGTLVFVVTMIVGFPFGWGKPVEYDPYNLQNPKRDAALISLAGPVSNLLLASVLSLIFRFVPFSFLAPIIVINVSLAVFNLIPIHPLDGGKILVALLPTKQARQYDLFLHKYGFLVLLFLVLPLMGRQSLISSVISPIINVLLTVFLPGSAVV